MPLKICSDLRHPFQVNVTLAPRVVFQDDFAVLFNRLRMRKPVPGVYHLLAEPIQYVLCRLELSFLFFVLTRLDLVLYVPSEKIEFLLEIEPKWFL